MLNKPPKICPRTFKISHCGDIAQILVALVFLIILILDIRIGFVNFFRRLNQCDQFGRFLKVDKLSNKSSPFVWSQFGPFLKASLLTLNCFGWFLGKFCKNLGFFLCQHLVILVSTNPIFGFFL